MYQLLPAILHDLPYTVAMMVWVVIVTLYIARAAYSYAVKKGYPERSGTYFGRKVIHILAGGLVALLLPFIFLEPYLPFIMAVLLTIMVYVPHRTGKLYYWFQDPENMYEVHFTLVWGILVLVLWFIDRSFWLAVVPLLFMSWGDGVTGIVRNLRYRKRVKGWEGSLAMLVVSVPIGAILGIAGVVAAVASVLAEKQPWVDDNVLVPVVSVAILLAAYFLFPGLLKSLY